MKITCELDEVVPVDVDVRRERVGMRNTRCDGRNEERSVPWRLTMTADLAEVSSNPDHAPKSGLRPILSHKAGFCLGTCARGDSVSCGYADGYST